MNTISAWDANVSKEGKRSIKISNAKPRNSKWAGDDITLKTPTTTFDFEGWSKAENVLESTRLYCLDFQVIFEDGTSKWHYKGLTFKKGTHDWEKVKTRVRFDKKVKAIRPHMLFHGGSGTVWFDEVKAMPVYNNQPEANILPNSGFEEELKERVNVSYSYSNTEWERIEQNMFSIINFLSNQQSKEKNVLLFTPFWNNGKKTAYPQKLQYKKLLEKVKNYCRQKKIVMIDASYLLTKDNFGIYTNGKVKDKIDVLHFDAAAHYKLANYIIKELNL